MSERLTLREDPNHLPDIPLTGGMRHQGLVNEAGEVVATVWNHHDHHACLDLARAMAQVPRMLALVGLVANWVEGQEMADEAEAILRACRLEP